jgi:hypothetical protein
MMLGGLVVNAILLIVNHWRSPYFTVDRQGDFALEPLGPYTPVEAIGVPGVQTNLDLVGNNEFIRSPDIYR